MSGEVLFRGIHRINLLRNLEKRPKGEGGGGGGRGVESVIFRRRAEGGRRNG